MILGGKLTELNKIILEEAQTLAPSVSEWRRELHRHPETGFELETTCEFVYNKLKAMGLEPVKCGKAGWVVLLGKPGKKVFLLRADMDALPLEEDSGEEFKSLHSGKMHACGHDMHTAMLLGAAQILKNHEDLLEGQVKLMFQPAEEISQGAKDMVESGVLENPKVDAAEMLHVASGAPFPAGLVMVPQGGTGASASALFTIRVTGKGGHGAMPSVCVDPITALCHIHTGLEEIFSRELGLTEYLAVTVGKIHGGEAANIIPNFAEMSGTIRTMSREKMEWVQKRITEIASGIATAYRAEAEVIYENFLPPMIADDTLVDCTLGYLKELLGPGVMQIPKGQTGGGSEDFAFVAERVPSIPLFLGAGCSADGYTSPAHHPKVRFDERALPVGTAAHAYNAIRWLQDHQE